MRAGWDAFKRESPSYVRAKRAALVAPYLTAGRTETMAIARMPASERRKVREYDRQLRESARPTERPCARCGLMPERHGQLGHCPDMESGR